MLPIFLPPPEELPDPQFQLLAVDPGDFEAEVRERTLGQLQAQQAARPDQLIFPAASLHAWAELATGAGLAVIPAEVVARVPKDVLLRCENPQPADLQHMAALEMARAQLMPHEMLRWDFCASLQLKEVMAAGRDAAKSELLSFEHEPDELNPALPRWRSMWGWMDPRIMDIMVDFPAEDVAIIKRPWVEARDEGGHPAEYRVFVQGGEVTGVANYYVQRDMPHSDQVHREVEQVLSASRQLLGHMARCQAVPFMPHAAARGFDVTTVSASLDFLIDRDGVARFLEAGPGFGLGAHPCAFASHAGPDGIGVEGVCLGSGPVLPLSDFERKPVRRASP